jgi:cytochrome oxidase Cu insertion factor (SCO1/SenC/PrrC family)
MNELSPSNAPPHVPRPAPSPSTSAALPFFLALAVLFVMAYGGWKWWQVRQFELSRGQAIPQNVIGPPITDFELTERSGQLFRSADMNGKVWVATYFFTTCPGNCLRLNQRLQVLNAMPELKDVTWVSITCDPDNDTLDALRTYADRWGADPNRWLFVRGPLEYTQQIAKGMKVFLERKGHQDHAIVFDKAGKIRGAYDATSLQECEQMHKKLLELLAEEPPQNVAATAGEKTSS